MNNLLATHAWRTAMASLLCCFVGLAFGGQIDSANAALTLQQAETLALEDNPAISRFAHQRKALQEEAVSAGQLPDPQLKIGVMSLPVDSFDFRQEPMTQAQFGIKQQFPPGKTRHIRKTRLQFAANAQGAIEQDQRLKTLLEVRLNYLDLFHQHRALEILEQTESVFDQLAEITLDYYASGQARQHDVYQVDLEASRLQERMIQVKRIEQNARAELTAWIGGEADSEVTSHWPELTTNSAGAGGSVLEHHPQVTSLDAQTKAAEAAVGLARQRYKPGYSIDLTWGQRSGHNPDGSSRDDFVSLMFNIDLPVFRANRQDRMVEAELASLDAIARQRDDLLRRLASAHAGELASIRYQREQLRLYEEHLLPEARDNADAALQAWQAALTDVTTLMRAQITEYEMKLSQLAARIDELKTIARIRYLAGEDL